MGIFFVFSVLLSVLVGPTVYAGLSYHSLIIKSDGSLHTFGQNSNGQLGDGTTTNRNTPTQILASGVSQIAAGAYHSLILKTDGSLHTFGLNNYGQLGNGTTIQRTTPTQILASGVSQIMNQSEFFTSNQTPTGLSSVGSLTISENQVVGTVVGELNATDPDGDPITYSLVSGAVMETIACFPWSPMVR